MQIEAIPMLINSDFMDIPLDKRLDLADYKMYGERSHVFQNKDRLHSLYECVGLTMNDLDICGEAFDYLVKNERAGIALATVYGINDKEVIEKSTAMQAIAASSTAIKMILLSTTAAVIIAKSSTALSALEQSRHLKHIVAPNRTASGRLVILKGKNNAYIVDIYAYYVVDNANRTDNVDQLGAFIKLFPGKFATYICTDRDSGDAFYYFDVA